MRAHKNACCDVHLDIDLIIFFANLWLSSFPMIWDLRWEEWIYLSGNSVPDFWYLVKQLQEAKSWLGVYFIEAAGADSHN